MKKKVLFCLGLGFFALLAAPGFAKDSVQRKKEIACTYNHKKPMSSGGAKLGMTGNTIHKIYFNTYYPGGYGTLGFTCHIDWRRGDADYAWQETARGTVITVKANGDTVVLRRDKKSQGYRLNFANLSQLSKYCGAGAEVPAAVFIPLNGKPCKVTMSVPQPNDAQLSQ